MCSSDLAEAPPGADEDRVRRGRVLRFPRDHGAHPGSAIEWWYLTGALWPAGADTTAQPPRWGFQLTFFRSATGLAATLPGRLAPRQLLFAHVAVTDLTRRQHRHEQRLARWNGESTEGVAWASREDTGVRLGRWVLLRNGPLRQGQPVPMYSVSVPADALALSLSVAPRHNGPALLLQGEQGFSRKGPAEAQASHYYSVPQLHAAGDLQVGGERFADVQGVAWLDHEWSDHLLAPEAQGWDWIGMNLDDGSALTAFQLRRRDGGVLWTGGSWRDPQGRLRVFGPDELRWTPGRTWSSPASGARYPVAWQLDTPVGRFGVRSMLDDQEMDSRASTGTTYWEGLSALDDAQGRRVGWGYLEMTGYQGRLAL